MLLRELLSGILKRPDVFDIRACHRLSSPASTPTRYAKQIDNNTDAGVFTDTSTVILTLYVITNRRGLARQLADGFDGVRKTTWLSQRRLLDGRSPTPSLVLLGC